MVSLRTSRAETTAERLLKQALLRDACTLLQGRSLSGPQKPGLTSCFIPVSPSGGSSLNQTACCKCRQQQRKGMSKTNTSSFLAGGFLRGHSEVRLAHGSH